MEPTHESSSETPLAYLQQPLNALNRIADAVSAQLDRFESRVGVAGAGLLLALAVMALACIYVRPAFDCASLGCDYAELARDPFPVGVENRVGYRVLTPLVSYFLGLRGENILITNLLFAWLLLAFLYWALRRERFSVHDAGVCTFAFGLSAPTLITVYYGGYTDSLTYLLLAISFFYRRRPLVFWTAFGLNLFNREAIAFLLPWLLYLRWRERQSTKAFWLEAGFACGLSLGAYEAFRIWTASRMNVEYTAALYFKPVLTNPLHYWGRSFGNQWIGFFSVFKLLWWIPLTALLYAIKQRERGVTASMLLLLGCVYAQFLFAWDSTRLFALGFPLMFIAYQSLIPGNVANIRKWLVPLCAVNLLVPNLYTAAHTLEIMRGPVFEIAAAIAR